MKYINLFKTHASYESELNVGGVDFKIPNVSYCKDVKDVHFNPYNLIKFYVGEITPPQTISIYTDATNHIDVTVNEGNKWYSYLLPKDKGLCWITGDSVKKVTIKANISYKSNFNPPHYFGKTIIPSSTVEVSFKGSNTSGVTDMAKMFNFCSGLTSLDVSNFDTSNVTDMFYMFGYCRGFTSLDLSKWDTSKVTRMNQMFTHCDGLTSLDLSGWDTSNVEDMSGMFDDCSKLSTIRMKGCSEDTINKITAVKPSTATIVTE